MKFCNSFQIVVYYCMLNSCISRTVISMWTMPLWHVFMFVGISFPTMKTSLRWHIPVHSTGCWLQMFLMLVVVSHDYHIGLRSGIQISVPTWRSWMRRNQLSCVEISTWRTLTLVGTSYRPTLVKLREPEVLDYLPENILTCPKQVSRLKRLKSTPALPAKLIPLSAVVGGCGSVCCAGHGSQSWTSGFPVSVLELRYFKDKLPRSRWWLQKLVTHYTTMPESLIHCIWITWIAALLNGLILTDLLYMHYKRTKSLLSDTWDKDQWSNMVKHPSHIDVYFGDSHEESRWWPKALEELTISSLSYSKTSCYHPSCCQETQLPDERLFLSPNVVWCRSQ